jgi:hypothetical protein
VCCRIRLCPEIKVALGKPKCGGYVLSISVLGPETDQRAAAQMPVMGNCQTVRKKIGQEASVRGWSERDKELMAGDGVRWHSMLI